MQSASGMTYVPDTYIPLRARALNRWRMAVYHGNELEHQPVCTACVHACCPSGRGRLNAPRYSCTLYARQYCTSRGAVACARLCAFGSQFVPPSTVYLLCTLYYEASCKRHLCQHLTRSDATSSHTCRQPDTSPRQWICCPLTYTPRFPHFSPCFPLFHT